MNPQYRPVQPPPKRRGLSVRSLIWLVIMGGGALYYLGVPWYAQRTFNSNFDKASAAFEAGDCAEAKRLYDLLATSRHYSKADFTTTDDIRSNGSVCGNYLSAVSYQSQGDFGSAFSAYHRATEPLGVPQTLKDQINQHISDVFASNDAAKLANATLCFETMRTSPSINPTTFTVDNTQRVTSVVRPLLDQMLEEGMIPESEKNVPLLTYECARYAMTSANYEQASTLFTRFVENFPDHALYGDAEDGLAEAIVQAATAAGAPEISRPDGIPIDGTLASVSIQNSSPERMRLTFVGPEIQIYQLDACTTCQTYTGTGPIACPEAGPEGYYELPPGTYQVVVESIGEYVTPYRGTWELESGFDYPQCFYIVTTFN